MDKIKVQDLHKSFEHKVVLEGINLDVKEGESVVIIGASGAGKSVLLKIILGILEPDVGSIWVDNQPMVGISWKTRESILTKFGMLFQNSALFDSLTVWENVAFGLIEARGINRSKAKSIAVEKLKNVGLGKEVWDLNPAELSGGMKKRVGLARAIATEPEILFFDEPTTGLDPIMGDVINDLIVARVKELGATAISITHDLASARKIGDRIAMLNDGRIIWSGPVSSIDNSGNEYLDQFIKGSAEGPIKMEILRG
ncbi:MAG: ATP-binding cassette domain-containing protein [Pseudomonadota bacterium]|nr:ATP-binding cassette domain-containing protein [Pseudomonadota bacterium]